MAFLKDIVCSSDALNNCYAPKYRDIPLQINTTSYTALESRPELWTNGITYGQACDEDIHGSGRPASKQRQSDNL